MSFVRANRDSKIRNSVLPLVPGILESAVGSTASVMNPFNALTGGGAAGSGGAATVMSVTGLTSGTATVTNTGPAAVGAAASVTATGGGGVNQPITAPNGVIDEARQTRLERFMNTKYFNAVINANPTE